MNPDLTTTIAQLRELMAKATPGPWHVDKKNGITVEAPSGNVLLVNLARNSQADPALIAAAINALPQLLAALSHPAIDPRQADSDYEIALSFATDQRELAKYTPFNDATKEMYLARAGWLEEIADRAEKYKALSHPAESGDAGGDALTEMTRKNLLLCNQNGALLVEQHDLKAKLAACEKERDLAIAHDRQPYPTAWAYEQACKALEKHRARADRLEAALRLIHDWRGLGDANANETFERIAEDFYCDTGVMRPGKDQPAAMNGPSCGERREAFEKWAREKTEAVNTAIRQALHPPSPATPEAGADDASIRIGDARGYQCQCCECNQLFRSQNKRAIVCDACIDEKQRAIPKPGKGEVAGG